MTPEQIEAIEANLKTAIDTAGGIATVFAPQFAAFIVLGQVIAKAVPGLAIDVQELLSKNDPTPAELSALAASIAALAHPEEL